jgi:CRISPR-associated endonuclease/helicase Cas3
VLIVDEAHAYDAYMSRLLDNLIRLHASSGGSVVILSATLSFDARDRIVDAFAKGSGTLLDSPRQSAFPLATYLADGELREYPIIASPPTTGEQMSHLVAVELVHEFEESANHLIATARNGRCACWIRNTVGEAVEAWEILRSRAPEPEKVLLFHARFALGHRQEIEDNVLQRFGKKSTLTDRAGFIVVSTQVIEQSLDLDFDEMVTDLAPIDLVIQRAGRLHRHDRRNQGRTGQPKLMVLGPDPTKEITANWYSDFFNGSQWVYRDHSIVWLTAETLRKTREIAVPSGARHLIESVYGELAPDFPEALLASNSEAFGDELSMLATADFNALDISKGYRPHSSGRWFDDSQTPTRLGDPTVRLRLGQVENEKFVPLIDADRYPWQLSEVSIRASRFRRPVVNASTRKILTAAAQAMHDRAKYCELVPLRTAPNGDFHCSIEDGSGNASILHYSSLRGLEIKTGSI